MYLDILLGPNSLEPHKISETSYGTTGEFYALATCRVNQYLKRMITSH